MIEMDENCCQNPNIKIIEGNRICKNCGLIHGPIFVHDYVEYNYKNIVSKSIYAEILMLEINSKILIYRKRKQNNL